MAQNHGEALALEWAFEDAGILPRLAERIIRCKLIGKVHNRSFLENTSHRASE